MENSVEFALPARERVPRIPLSTLDQRQPPPLTWEQLSQVESKLVSMFGPNLDDIFVTTNSGTMSAVSMTLTQPIPSVAGSMHLPSPRTADPRRSGINLSVSDPTTPRSGTRARVMCPARCAACVCVRVRVSLCVCVCSHHRSTAQHKAI